MPKLAKLCPMSAGYLIWGRIEHIAPQQFAVIVSAITEDGRDTAGVIVRIKESREDAARRLRP